LLIEPETGPQAQVQYVPQMVAHFYRLAHMAGSLKLSVAQLKELYRARKLPVGGKKTDLVRRLEEGNGKYWVTR
jgi:hypothetical protein